MGRASARLLMVNAQDVSFELGNYLVKLPKIPKVPQNVSFELRGIL